MATWRAGRYSAVRQRIGRLRLPSAPGLGIRLDESVLSKYRLVAGKVPDGNYSDMAFGPAETEPVPAYSAGWHESA